MQNRHVDSDTVDVCVKAIVHTQKKLKNNLKSRFDRGDVKMDVVRCDMMNNILRDPRKRG